MGGSTGAVSELVTLRMVARLTTSDGRAVECDTGVMWNPDVYLAFADHRGRPFFDLLSRVGAETPRRVVDLGCGPGNLTVSLAQRWPDAVVEAWDSSPEMVEAARERGVDAHVGDVRDVDAAARYRCRGEQRHAAVGARTRRAAGPVGGSAGRRVMDRHAGAGELRRTVASGRPGAGPPRSVVGTVAGLPVSRGTGRSTRQGMRSCSPTRAAPSTPGRPPTSTS